MRKSKMIITSIFTITLLSYFFINRWTKASDTSTYNPNVGNAPITAEQINTNPDQQNKNGSDNYTYIPPVLEYDSKDDKQNGDSGNMDNISTGSQWTPATEIDLDPESITVIVNKELTLPKDYVPANMIVPNIPFDIKRYDDKMLMRPEAAKAIEKLFAAAEKEGYKLYGISGYRSYKRQYDIFTTNLVMNGKSHTVKYSAVPGTSEHQTGLAMDVSIKSLRYRLITSFSNTSEGRWLAENAHIYGFILRYPKDMTEVTGYEYEPWHIRFVGEDLANYLYINNLTLEEYYNYIPSDGFDFETKYAEILSFKPTPTPSPIPEEELEGDDNDLEDLENEDALEDDLDEGTEDEDGLGEDNLDGDDEKPGDDTDEDIIDEDIDETEDSWQDNPNDGNSQDENPHDDSIIINPNTGEPVRNPLDDKKS